MSSPGNDPDVPPEIQEHLLEESYKRSPRFIIAFVLLVAAAMGAMLLFSENSLGLFNAGHTAQQTLSCANKKVDRATRNTQDAWFAQHKLTISGTVDSTQVVVATVGEPDMAEDSDMFVVWLPATCEFTFEGVINAQNTPANPSVIPPSVSYDQSKFTALLDLSAVPLPSDEDQGDFVFVTVAGSGNTGLCETSTVPPTFSSFTIDDNTGQIGNGYQITLTCASTPTGTA